MPTEPSQSLSDGRGTEVQGQEAPISLCSMKTSSPEDAPRGILMLTIGERQELFRGTRDSVGNELCSVCKVR